MPKPQKMRPIKGIPTPKKPIGHRKGAGKVRDLPGVTAFVVSELAKRLHQPDEFEELAEPEKVEVGEGVEQIDPREIQWEKAAWFNDQYSLMQMSSGLRQLLLDESKAKGNGAILLLERLTQAEDEGNFEEVAREIAEEFDREVTEVYQLFRSPQLEFG